MLKKIIFQPKIKRLKTLDWFVIAAFALVVVAVMVIRPVPILPEKDLLVLKGKVIAVYEGGVNDVNLKLEGHNELYYVNRGLERGLNIDKLRKQLTNDLVVIKYPDHWTLLNFNKSTIHISKIEHDGKTVFSEVN